MSVTQFRRDAPVEAVIMIMADMPPKIAVSTEQSGNYLISAYCRSWRELPALTRRCQEIEQEIRAGRITSGFKELRR